MKAAVEVCLGARQRVFALVTAMAGMVETSIDQAIQAQLVSDPERARAVLERELAINRLEMHIDAAILVHLEYQHVGSGDIRDKDYMLKINKDLERMGDLAANIARKVVETGKSGEEGESSNLQPMAIAVSHICRKTFRALLRQDVVLAESARDDKKTVHNYRDYVFRRIRERLGSGSSETSSDVALLLVSRYLEQIADHAINLADSLIFWLRGKPEGELLAG